MVSHLGNTLGKEKSVNDNSMASNSKLKITAGDVFVFLDTMKGAESSINLSC